MSGGESLREYLSARRGEIETALAAALPAPPDCPAVVADAMRYSVMAGGKRLRPVLCLAAADAVASKPPAGASGAGDRAAAARALARQRIGRRRLPPAVRL